MLLLNFFQININRFKQYNLEKNKEKVKNAIHNKKVKKHIIILLLI